MLWWRAFSVLRQLLQCVLKWNLNIHNYDQNYENNGTLHPTSFETGRLGVKNMVKSKMFDGGSAKTQRLGKLCKSLFDVLDQFVESGALTKQEVNYAYIEISKLLTKCEKVDGKYSAY